jgi:transposase
MASPQRTPEFRAEAVRIALTSGLSRKQVAADLGVGFSTLSRWIQQDQHSPEKPTAQSDMERELAELRKENRLLREEYPSWSSRFFNPCTMIT